jgi:hypothetical protein
MESSLKGIKMYPKDWWKMFVSHMFGQRFIAQIQKGVSKHKNNMIKFLKAPNRHFKKMTYGW